MGINELTPPCSSGYLLPLPLCLPSGSLLSLLPLKAGWWRAAAVGSVSSLNLVNYRGCRSNRNGSAGPCEAGGGQGWTSSVKPLWTLQPKHLHSHPGLRCEPALPPSCLLLFFLPLYCCAFTCCLPATLPPNFSPFLPFFPSMLRPSSGQKRNTCPQSP